MTKVQKKAQRKTNRNSDTIAAVSTPRGTGGIHVIRLSGPESRRIADSVFRGNTTLSGSATHRAHYGKIIDPETDALIDQAVATVMIAPKSYTCEDVVEISVHGSQFVAGKALELLISQGARLAEPGEFTQRAYLNGRLDLSQAEAVADLISSRTDLSHRAALEQLSGRLSESVKVLRSKLVESLALLEAYIDFPEEAIEEKHYDTIVKSVAEADAEIAKLISSYETGRIMRDGLCVPLVGPPNSGKSSLFNYFLNTERAIVTELPGTTRDTISESIDIGGIAVELIDTAGIRESEDRIEIAGIERTREQIEKADLIVAIVDCSEPDCSRLMDDIGGLLDGKTVVRVFNKLDIVDSDSLGRLKSGASADDIHLSATTGEGTDRLIAAIRDRGIPDAVTGTKGEVLVTNLRHRNALRAAKEDLEKTSLSMREGLSHELVAFELRSAVSDLEEIVGTVAPDEVLHRIFDSFCIGK